VVAKSAERRFMKTKNKVILFLSLAAASVLAADLTNRIIRIRATMDETLKKTRFSVFSFKEGKIAYREEGSGSPLLLIHDLKCYASGKDWEKIVPALSEGHTVYTPDLLGCGLSDKPNLIYTNFLYTEVLNTFIRTKIGNKTDVICEGASVPLVVMAARMAPELFGKIIFISPESLSKGVKAPDKSGRLYRTILNLPVFGTFLYHIAVGRQPLAEQIFLRDFFEPCLIPDSYLNTRYESAHLGDSPKSLYASIAGNYTCCDIRTSLRDLPNEVLLITGAAEKDGNRTAEEFYACSPKINRIVLGKCKRFPQIEKPADFLREVKDFL